MTKKTKRYYWLKLPKNFFSDKSIKYLRKLSGGDTYTIIYLKLLLLSLDRDGKIVFEGYENTISEEIALEIDESPKDVEVTFNFLSSKKLIEEVSENEIFLTRYNEMVGSETTKAESMRQLRARRKK